MSERKTGSGRQIVSSHLQEKKMPLAVRFTPLQTIGVIAIAVMAGAIPALQPLLLGGMMQLGRLTASQIGQAATAEALGMTLSATMAASMLRPNHLRAISACVLIVALIANLLTTVASGLEVILARFLHGLAAGVMLWLLVGMFTRVAAPARLFAFYITGQATASFVLSGLFTAVVLPHFGVRASYLVLACAELALILLAACVPRNYPLIEGAAIGGLPPLPGLIGLASAAFYLAGILGFWVYVAPLLRSVGHSEAIVRTAITFAIGIQILAGLTASALATKLSAVPTCIVGALASIGCIVALLFPLPPVLLFVFIGGFAFFWMLVPPFHVPFLVGLDPSHRAAMLVSAAQIGGSALGPLLGATLVPIGGFKMAALAAIGLFAASAIGVVLARQMMVQQAPVRIRSA